NAGARALRGPAHPVRRRAREEERREGDDRQQPGKDERKPADDGADATAQPPGAEDRELSRRGPREEVAGGDRVLELGCRQPVVPLDAEPAKQRDVRGRAAEARAPDARPLAEDHGERGWTNRPTVTSPFHGRRAAPFCRGA